MFKDKLRVLFNFDNKNDENEIGAKNVDGVKNNMQLKVRKNENKKMENIVFAIILIIIVVVFINYIWNDEKASNVNKKVQQNNLENHASLAKSDESGIADKESGSYKNSLEIRLEEILKNINGVGDVKIFINYSESSQTVAMYNENVKNSITEEKDTSGETRKIQETDTQKEIVYEEADGNKKPIIQKTIEPKIEGAIIVVKGASNINIKTSIIQAVEAVTGLATHKIQVFEMAN